MASEAARSEPSYVARAWDEMYLSGRWPLALNSNPGTVLYERIFADDLAGETAQVPRAARMVAAAVAFAEQVEAGTLAPDVFKGVPVDMRQCVQQGFAPRIACVSAPCTFLLPRTHAPPRPLRYPRMFSSTRLPRHGSDVLHKATPPARHIVVLRREHFWAVPVYGADGAPLITTSCMHSPMRIHSVISDGAPLITASCMHAPMRIHSVCTNARGRLR